MIEDPSLEPPREFNKLRDLIVESRSKMPRRLAQVAAYTIECPDDIAFGTVSRISEQAAVQPSTLVRFAKALGYSGFSELQAVFQQRLRDRPNNYEARLQAFDAHASGRPHAMALIEGLSQAAVDSIGKFRERIKLESLDEAAQILAKAETVYLIGVRRSYPIVSYLSYAFGTLGVRSVLAKRGRPRGSVVRRSTRRRYRHQFYALCGGHRRAHAANRRPEDPARRDH